MRPGVLANSGPFVFQRAILWKIGDTSGFLERWAGIKARRQVPRTRHGTGIATAWLLEGMDAHSSLISVDSDAAVQQIARDSLGSDALLEIVTAHGLEFLRLQPPASFDLAKPGGFYVIDDLLPQPNWTEGHAAKVPVLMEQLAARPDFGFLPVVWASGVVVAVRLS
ncbi:MAG TPA: hypothetical protein VHZ74_06145 [Bryobacteraceae bacterium]|nr:hypothetical protein [Bryobacteraceae bacterium]